MERYGRVVGILLITVFEQLILLNIVVQIHLSPHACGTQMTGHFTMNVFRQYKKGPGDNSGQRIVLSGKMGPFPLPVLLQLSLNKSHFLFSIAFIEEKQQT